MLCFFSVCASVMRLAKGKVNIDRVCAASWESAMSECLCSQQLAGADSMVAIKYQSEDDCVWRRSSMRCERGSEADETGSDGSPPVTGSAETRSDAATTRRLGMIGEGRGTQGRSDDDPNTNERLGSDWYLLDRKTEGKQ
jgi:hypothetical protein